MEGDVPVDLEVGIVIGALVVVAPDFSTDDTVDNAAAAAAASIVGSAAEAGDDSNVEQSVKMDEDDEDIEEEEFIFIIGCPCARSIFLVGYLLVLLMNEILILLWNLFHQFWVAFLLAVYSICTFFVKFVIQTSLYLCSCAIFKLS